MTKKIIFGLTIFLLIARLCATAADAYTFHGLERDVDVIDIRGDGHHYLLLTDVCSAHGIDLEWDSILRKIILRKNGIEVVILVGSKYYFTGDEVKKMKSQVLMKDGLVYVPFKFAKYTVKNLFKDSTRIEKIRARLIPKATPEKTAKGVERPSDRRFAIRKVVMDPGHGGKDPGAIGKTGLLEKNLVLDISRRIKKELERYGIEVIMTRNSDKFVPLRERGEIANKNNADLFVSIHANANRRRWIRGFETYFLSDATDDNARALAAAENSVTKYEESSFARHSKVLDAIVWDLAFDENRKASIQLAEFICQQAHRRLNLKRYCVKSARFYVLKCAEIPAVLVELSYISNKWDEKNLKVDDYKQKLAEGVAAGIMDFKRAYDEANGFSR